MYRNAPFIAPRLVKLGDSDLGLLKRPSSSYQVSLDAKKSVKITKPNSAPQPSLFVTQLQESEPEIEMQDIEEKGDGSTEHLNIDIKNPCENRRYPIQWRKKSSKKNKSWEGDGFLVSKSNSLTIIDEDGNFLSKKSVPATEIPSLKDIISIGIYEVRIDDFKLLASEKQVKTSLSTRKPNNCTLVATKPSIIQSCSQTDSQLSNTEASKYYVQWRKKSNKKNKSWEGDGFLLILGKIMTLKDDEGRLLSKKTLHPTDNIDLSNVISISIYELEVSKEIDSGEQTLVKAQESIPIQYGNLKKVLGLSSTKCLDNSNVELPSSLALPQSNVNLQGDLTKVYSIQWRKKTNKKNKTWEGDGILRSTTSNGSTTLIAKDLNQKIIGKKTFCPAISPSILGTVFTLGGIEFEIDEVLNVDDDADQVEKATVTQPSNESTPFKPVRVISFTSEENPRQPSLEVGLTSIYSNPKTIPLPKYDNCKFDVSIDPHLAGHLRPHQIEGVSFLYECVMGLRNYNGNGCLLADEMGLGKTLMTITLIWTLLKQSPFKKGPTINKILIVCPVTLINNWVHEFVKWLGKHKVGILTLTGNGNNDKSSIVNFDRLNVYQVLIINYEKVGTYFQELSGVLLDLLICDEGHRLKTSSNKVLNYLTKLKIPKKVLLTGTPIQNDLTEFYTIINFINPGVLGEFKLFQKTYINTIVKSRDVHCFDAVLKRKGEELSKELIAITQPFILRRTQSILTKYLTDKTDTIIFVPPTPLQANLFNYILNLPKFNQEIDNGNQAFTLINLFKKICNSPSLLSNDSFYTSIEDSKKNFQLTTSSGKINILIPLLLEITSLNEKIVLISNYTKTLNLLELILKKLNLQFIRLDGSTPNNMRTKLVNAFNKTPSIHVFLLSSKSGGMGINLVGASRLILFDNDWNPAVDLQSMSRIHRDGQKKQCYLYRIMTTGCIDEKIFQRQLMKNNLSSTFLDNESKRNDNVFDEYEMKKLFEIDYSTVCNTHDLLDCECGGKGNEQIEEADVTIEDLAEEDVSLRQSSWISAKDLLNSVDENENEQILNKKTSMRNALSGYIHFDPKFANPNHLKDQVLANIIQNLNFKEVNGKPPISFIFSKPTNKIDVYGV